VPTYDSRVETKTPFFISAKSENKQKFAHFSRNFFRGNENFRKVFEKIFDFAKVFEKIFVFAKVFVKNFGSRDGFCETFR
jgi:hypothetical protein